MTKYTTQPISHRVHVRLNALHDRLSVPFFTKLCTTNSRTIIHYSDVGFFMRNGLLVTDLNKEIRKDIAAILKVFKLNNTRLTASNQTQKELIKRFNKVVPSGGIEIQKEELSEAFIAFSDYVKTIEHVDLIDQFETIEHNFLGYGDFKPIVTFNNKSHFKTDMELPVDPIKKITYFPVEYYGDKRHLLDAIYQLRALEKSLQRAYTRVACGVSLKDTPYHDLTSLIIKEHSGEHYIAPYYDSRNTDFLMLLISMVIRLRLAVVRSISRLGS